MNTPNRSIREFVQGIFIYLYEAAQKEQRLRDASSTSSGSTVHHDILAINFQCQPLFFSFFQRQKVA